MSQNAQAIFRTAREMPPEKREGFLEGACGIDVALRSKVEALLRADAEAGAFVESMDQVRVDSDPTLRKEDGPTPAPRDESTSEQPGQMIGRYKLLQPIGEGGFGSVWMAEQKEPVKRRVALKIIKLGMDTKQVIARFEAERQALAMMDHPNIAKVLDAGATDSGRPYFVMEYIRGVPILEYCDTEKLETRARLNLFVDVCHAIQHAHQKGIIHRDIKPTNVLVTLHDGKPVPKVIDFGIAKATNQELTDKTLFTQHRQMIGTPAYMSPEQAEMSGLDIDTRSDVYSLGVLLYELLTGTTPFSNDELLSKGYAEMMRIIRETEPHKPSTRLSTLGATASRTAQQRHVADPKRLGMVLRGDLDWIVMKCLEKDRSRRYDTANGLAMDIHRHLRDEPVTAGPPSTAYRLRKFMKRNRASVVASCIMLFATVVGLAGLSFGLWRTATANGTLQILNNELTEANRQLDISLTETTAQRDRAANAERRTDAINDYLVQGILAAAQPDQLGHDARVVDVLDRASQSIPERLRDDADLRAELYKTLAWTYDRIGLFQPALEAALASRESLREAHGGSLPRDDDRLVIEDTIAQNYLHLGELDRAEERSVELLSWAADPGVDMNRANVLAASVTLAQIREAQRRSQEAVEILRPVIAELRTQHPIDRQITLTALGSFASSLTTVGEFDQALEAARELRTLALEWNGPSSESAMYALNTLAVVYRLKGDMTTAAEILVTLADEGATYFGPTHPAQYAIAGNAGMVLRSLGRFDEAEPYLLRAYDAAVRVHGEYQYEAERVSTFLSDFYRQAGRPADALPWLERRYVLRYRIAGPGEEESLRKIWNEAHEQLAALHDVLGTSNPASFRDVALAAASSTPEGHNNRARVLGNVARALMSVKDYDEAERLLLLAAPAVEYSARLEETRQIVFGSLHTLYLATGQTDEAERWRAPE